MPQNMSAQDVSKIELKANKIGSDGTASPYIFEDSNSDSVEWIPAADKNAVDIMLASKITLDYGKYDFTLNLYTGEERLTQTAELSGVEINSAEITLEFKASYVSSGNFSLTLEWDAESDGTSRIGMVKAGLFTLESLGASPVESDEEEGKFDFKSLTIVDSENVGENLKSAEYAFEEVPNGTYLVKFALYDDDEGKTLLNTITDIVKVHGYKTQKTINLDL